MISVIRALAVGAIGGSLAFMIGVPAPWLAGSLVATIIAVYSNQNLELPDWVRTLAFILLGIQTGTAVNADTLYRAAQWPLSILCMSVTVVIIVWACMLYYERLRKWDTATAYFASLPGEQQEDALRDLLSELGIAENPPGGGEHEVEVPAHHLPEGVLGSLPDERAQQFLIAGFHVQPLISARSANRTGKVSRGNAQRSTLNIQHRTKRLQARRPGAIWKLGVECSRTRPEALSCLSRPFDTRLFVKIVSLTGAHGVTRPTLLRLLRSLL